MPLDQQQEARIDRLLSLPNLTTDQITRLQRLKGVTAPVNEETNFDPVPPVVRGMTSELMGAFQGTNPASSGRQKLGGLIETDAGFGFMQGKEFVLANPNEHVVLPDSAGS